MNTDAIFRHKVMHETITFVMVSPLKLLNCKSSYFFLLAGNFYKNVKTSFIIIPAIVIHNKN